MSAKESSKQTNPPRATSARRWAFRLAALVLVPLFVLGGIEGALCVFHYGFSTNFFSKTPDGAAFGVNEKFLFQFYSGNAAKGKTQPFLIPNPKPAGTTRIFLFGESAAQGTPEPAFGFIRILEVMLRSQFPQQRFEFVNAAMRGVNSHILLPAARDCASKSPDVFILYIGNNEVVGLHSPGPDSTIVDRHLALSRALQRFKSLRLGQWITGLREKSKPARKQDMEFFREHRIAFDEPGRQRAYRHFERNLEDICRAAERAGAKTVLSTIAVNLKDFPPIGSLHRANLTPAEQAQWESLYAKGAAAETSGQYQQAVEQFLAAARLDDHYAELQFRLARCDFALNQFDEARRHYALACDWDAMPFRADAKVNEVIRRVAASHQGGAGGFVDVERAFAESDLSDRGIPGDRLFHDHVHLNFDGDYLIAKTLFPAIVAALGKSSAAGSTVPSRKECAQALAFTKWGELQIDAGVVASRNVPPFLDQLEHAQWQAAAEQALKTRQQQITQSDLQEGAATFTAALARNPQDWHLHTLYGRFALEQGDFQTALDNLRFPVNLFPDRLGPRMGYAAALARAGNRSEAIAQYQEVLRIDPGNALAEQTLTWLYSQQGPGGKR